ncbi:MAG: hypothetical protein AB7T01_02055 [Acidithiobacillus sp.]
MNFQEIFRKSDQALIRYFERPAPRRVAEILLFGVTHVERLFFFPFRALSLPALWLLEHYAQRTKKVRDRLNNGGGFS